MAVAGEEDDVVGFGFFQEVDEALAFQREVRPFFKAVFGGDDLDAGDDDAEFGWFFEFCFEPLPLGVAEHGGLGVFVGEVAFASVDPASGEGGAEVAGVEREDLDPVSFTPVGVAVVDAGGFSGRVIGGEFEGVLEDFLRFFFLRIFGAGVIEAVVVIVPDGENFGFGAEFPVAFVVEKDLVFLFQDGHVMGVAVDVVAHEKEDLGVRFAGDRFPDVVGVTRGFVAGAAGDAGEGRVGGQDGEREEKKTKRADHDGAIQAEEGWVGEWLNWGMVESVNGNRS